MFRWNNVPNTSIFDMTVKMYREPFRPGRTVKINNLGLELDHYAYKYLGSEAFMYKILDTNWTEFMEERGDVSRMQSIMIPIDEAVNG